MKDVGVRCSRLLPKQANFLFKIIAVCGRCSRHTEVYGDLFAGHRDVGGRLFAGHTCSRRALHSNSCSRNVHGKYVLGENVHGSL
jgi:hypothetical protein